MKCDYTPVGKSRQGTRYQCQNPGCGHRRTSKLPPEKLHRQCPADAPPIGWGTWLKRVIEALGLGWFPAWYRQAFGRDCGCRKRESMLNRLFGGKRKGD